MNNTCDIQRCLYGCKEKSDIVHTCNNSCNSYKIGVITYDDISHFAEWYKLYKPVLLKSNEPVDVEMLIETGTILIELFLARLHLVQMRRQ